MNQIYLTIILTASAGAVGFLIRMFIDNINDILKNKKLDKLKHNEFLLSEFYMPIYILLHRENAIWENLIRSDCIIKKQEFITELDTEILNNHLEIQKIIINNMAKASPREDIACQLLLYDNHVTIFKTLRKIGSKDFPLKYHCEYPKNLYIIPKAVNNTTKKRVENYVANNPNEKAKIKRIDDYFKKNQLTYFNRNTGKYAGYKPSKSAVDLSHLGITKTSELENLIRGTYIICNY